jgi:hypothetical protein
MRQPILVGSSITPRGGDAKVHGRMLPVAPIELADLLLSASQADLETFDLAEPTFRLGFGDSGDQVVADLGKPRPLGRVRSEEPTSDASFSELHSLGWGLIGTYCQVTTSTEAGRGNGIISHPKGQSGSRCSAASISRHRGTRHVHHRAPPSGRSGHGIVARR